MLERRLTHLLRRFMRSSAGEAFDRIIVRLYPRDRQDWVAVNEVTLVLPHLHPVFDRFILVQISDLHLGTWMRSHHLEQVVSLVNAQKPDLIAITGDFVTYPPEEVRPDLVKSLRRLHAASGKVAVLGNHDHWSSPVLIREMLREAGVIELANTVFELSRGPRCLQVAGVDDYMEGNASLDGIIQDLRPEGCAILLAHEPDFAEVSAPTGRFDLQLSGHSHGGQIIFPWIGPLFLPSYARRYPRGLYRVEEMMVYTNRGLGTAEIPLRLNCKAEITVFHLRSSPRLLNDCPPAAE